MKTELVTETLLEVSQSIEKILEGLKHFANFYSLGVELLANILFMPFQCLLKIQNVKVSVCWKKELQVFRGEIA